MACKAAPRSAPWDGIEGKGRGMGGNGGIYCESCAFTVNILFKCPPLAPNGAIGADAQKIHMLSMLSFIVVLTPSMRIFPKRTRKKCEFLRNPSCQTGKRVV